MTAAPLVRESTARDGHGIYHRRVWIMSTGFRRLKCEPTPEGALVEVPGLPENLEDWQLCGFCYPPRGSDVLV